MSQVIIPSIGRIVIVHFPARDLPGIVTKSPVIDKMLFAEEGSELSRIEVQVFGGDSDLSNSDPSADTLPESLHRITIQDDAWSIANLVLSVLSGESPVWRTENAFSPRYSFPRVIH